MFIGKTRHCEDIKADDIYHLQRLRQSTRSINMEELKSRNEYLKATNADGTCILEATATWCPQCKAIAPFVDKLIKQFPEARFYKYDTDTAGDIAQELGVNQMPTFHIFKNGDMGDSVTGAKAKELEKAIKESYDGKVVEQ